MGEQFPTILEWHFYIHLPRLELCRVQSGCTHMPPAPVVMGPTWMGSGSEATAHTSASRAGKALEGRLRHLLHRAVAPSTSTTYWAGIRKYYAFCHKFNLNILPRNQVLHQPFYWVSQSNGECGRIVYGSGKFIKVGMLTLLT